VTARELTRRGHEALLAPLSEIRLLDTEVQDLAGVQAVLATSSNGVRAFAGRCGRKDIPLFAVGANTAAAARSAGFTQVSSAEGDSSALAAAVCAALTPNGGALLHVTGKIRSAEVHRELAGAGFECRVLELYDVIPCHRLPEQVITAFRTDEVDAVLVFSPESGRILVEALKNGSVTPKCARVVACCISEAAAVKIRNVEFGAIRIARKPTLDAVLALLDNRPAE